MTQYFGKTHETFATPSPTTVAPQTFSVVTDVDDKVLKFGGNKFVALKNKEGLISIYSGSAFGTSKADLKPLYFVNATVTTTVAPTAAEYYNAPTTKGVSSLSHVLQPVGMSEANLTKLKSQLKSFTGFEATFTDTTPPLLKLGDKKANTCANDIVCAKDTLLQRGQYQKNIMPMIIIAVSVLLLIILIVVLSGKKKRFNYTSPYRFSYPSYAYQSYY